MAQRKWSGQLRIWKSVSFQLRRGGQPDSNGPLIWCPTAGNCVAEFVSKDVFHSLSSGEDCLTLALKGRCQNQLKRRQAGPERLMGNGHGRLAGGALHGSTITTSGGSRLGERAIGGLCEVHFLPLVVGVGDSNRTQRLRCVGGS